VSKEKETIHGWWHDGELSVQLESLQLHGVGHFPYAGKVDLGSDEDEELTIPNQRIAADASNG